MAMTMPWFRSAVTSAVIRESVYCFAVATASDTSPLLARLAAREYAESARDCAARARESIASAYDTDAFPDICDSRVEARDSKELTRPPRDVIDSP